MPGADDSGRPAPKRPDALGAFAVGQRFMVLANPRLGMAFVVPQQLAELEQQAKQKTGGRNVRRR